MSAVGTRQATRPARPHATEAAKAWPRVPLGEVITQAKAGFASGKRADTGVVQLRMNNVDTAGRLVWESFLRVPADDATISEYALARHDVLFNNTNSTALVGKTALFVEHDEPVVYSNHFTRLRTDRERLDPAYLARWLNHEWRRGTFAEICNQWIGQSAVKPEKLLALEIPLPPLAEQERIAGRLTEQLGAVERARAAAAQRLAAAEALPAALLREVFDGPQASGWETRTLADLGPLQTGFAFKSEWFKPDGVRILRNANIHQGFLEWDDVVRVPESMTDRFAAFSLEVGDIVLTLDRPLVANGLKVARITKDDLPSLLNQRVARFRFDSAQLDADYLYAFLRSALFIDAIRGHDQSLGVPHISPAQVEAVEIPLPDPPTQRRIATDLSARLAAAEGVIARCREELAAIEALPAALLRDAFGGNAATDGGD